MSLEHGEAGICFNRQLVIHWQMIFKGADRKKRRRQVVRKTRSPRELWEANRMEWENALSYAIRYY